MFPSNPPSMMVRNAAIQLTPLVESSTAIAWAVKCKIEAAPTSTMVAAHSRASGV